MINTPILLYRPSRFAARKNVPQGSCPFLTKWASRLLTSSMYQLAVSPQSSTQRSASRCPFITNLLTDFCLILDAFGMQLNASSTVEGILSDWCRFFKDRWIDFAHLTILSFHRLNGSRIDDTALAANPQVLLPIVNGAVDGCQKQDVKFACVQCTLDFTTVAGLITIYPYPASTTIHASYYIELPQGSCALTNGAGAP
jgi:hypothetical protein